MAVVLNGSVWTIPSVMMLIGFQFKSTNDQIAIFGKNFATE